MSDKSTHCSWQIQMQLLITPLGTLLFWIFHKWRKKEEKMKEEKDKPNLKLYPFLNTNIALVFTSIIILKTLLYFTAQAVSNVQPAIGCSLLQQLTTEAGLPCQPVSVWPLKPSVCHQTRLRWQELRWQELRGQAAMDGQDTNDGLDRENRRLEVLLNYNNLFSIKHLKKKISCFGKKLDGVGPVDNRPSTD